MGAADYLLLPPRAKKLFSSSGAEDESKKYTWSTTEHRHYIYYLSFAEASLFALGPQYISNQS